MIKNIASESASKASVKALNPDKLKTVCAEFESLFIRYLMKSMRSSVTETGFLGNSEESKIFKSMFDEKLSDEIATSGGIGLGRVLFEQLKDRKS